MTDLNRLGGRHWPFERCARDVTVMRTARSTTSTWLKSPAGDLWYADWINVKRVSVGCLEQA